MFTPISTAPLTQSIPTTDDGYQYILLGNATSTTLYYLLPNHPIFEYKNGKFGLVGTALASESNDGLMSSEDKKILDVIEEIKKSNSGSVYFVSEEEKKEDKKRRTVTRTNSKVQEKQQKEENGEGTEGSLAKRLFARKQTTKNSYFSHS